MEKGVVKIWILKEEWGQVSNQLEQTWLWGALTVGMVRAVAERGLLSC